MELGIVKLSDNGLMPGVASKTYHSQYNSNTIDYDYGVVELKTAVSQSQVVYCLPSKVFACFDVQLWSRKQQFVR